MLLAVLTRDATFLEGINPDKSDPVHFTLMAELGYLGLLDSNPVMDITNNTSESQDMQSGIRAVVKILGMLAENGQLDTAPELPLESADGWPMNTVLFAHYLAGKHHARSDMAAFHLETYVRLAENTGIFLRLPEVYYRLSNLAPGDTDIEEFQRNRLIRASEINSLIIQNSGSLRPRLQTLYGQWKIP